MSDPVPTLQVDNVTVTLGGVAVVKDVSFSLHETDLALLSGPNGAGKSTLLWAIVFLLPFAGDITIVGHHPASLEAQDELTLMEHCELWEKDTGMKLSYVTMHRLCKRLGISRKKRPFQLLSRTRKHACCVSMTPSAWCS